MWGATTTFKYLTVSVSDWSRNVSQTGLSDQEFKYVCVPILKLISMIWLFFMKIWPLISVIAVCNSTFTCIFHLKSSRSSSALSKIKNHQYVFLFFPMVFLNCCGKFVRIFQSYIFFLSCRQIIYFICSTLIFCKSSVPYRKRKLAMKSIQFHRRKIQRLVPERSKRLFFKTTVKLASL